MSNSRCAFSCSVCVFVLALPTMSSAPAGGWKNLRDKGGNKSPFSIYNMDDVSNEMPRAHTCFNKIDL